MKTEKLKNSKGITLIALIITIIVMLILVGVTVNVAMQAGLFNTASDASKKTQAEAYKEELSAAVAGAYDAVTGEINGDKLVSNLGTKWSVEGTGPYTCAINGDAFNTFIVSKKGEIGQTINYEEIFKTAKKHPEQQNTNDIGIAEDGSPVNLDLWNYEYYSYADGFKTKFTPGENTGGYLNKNIIDGKIQGKVPMYIKREGETDFYPLVSLDYAFAYCTDMTEGPKIPSCVMYMSNTFKGCTSLTTSPVIPSGVVDLNNAFFECRNLAGTLTINSNPNNCEYMLYGAVAAEGSSLKLTGDCSLEKLNFIAGTRGPLGSGVYGTIYVEK